MMKRELLRLVIRRRRRREGKCVSVRTYVCMCYTRAWPQLSCPALSPFSLTGPGWREREEEVTGASERVSEPLLSTERG